MSGKSALPCGFGSRSRIKFRTAFIHLHWDWQSLAHWEQLSPRLLCCKQAELFKMKNSRLVIESFYKWHLLFCQVIKKRELSASPALQKLHSYDELLWIFAQIIFSTFFSHGVRLRFLYIYFSSQCQRRALFLSELSLPRARADL